MNLKFLAVCALLVLSAPAFSKDTAMTISTNKVGENLDLELVSAEFGAAKDLEDFEKRLNDPKTQVSNLDLNNDGQVDYLIVSERKDNNVHYVDIDASIGQDKKQTVATIQVNKSSSSESIQIIGETSIYGTNYVYVPTYVQPPVFFTLFWVSTYQPWYSPWHWGYYPPIYHPWGVRPINSYRGDVNVNINKYNNVIVNKNNTIRDIDRNNSMTKIGDKTDGHLKKTTDGSDLKSNVNRAKSPNRERNVAAKPVSRESVQSNRANRAMPSTRMPATARGGRSRF
ncbi:hypothetical protein [Hydromonas duriensis]|uniref:DUF3300 domain-containing protein n=1 Tax=Hydromonas duriensis TaxID=1527608 RepID=A0A4V3DJR2_9BURK|nr:hypothetical protein [Hydromonas duriensis]TDR31066.1 hypothetical protein DFR44_11318 [Hydromonas duriensis]